jgi:hypothetical protein
MVQAQFHHGKANTNGVPACRRNGGANSQADRLPPVLPGADVNGILTQLAAWIAGVVVVLLVAQTDWADGIAIGDMSLEHAGVLVAGLLRTVGGLHRQLRQGHPQGRRQQQHRRDPRPGPRSTARDDGPKEVG